MRCISQTEAFEELWWGDTFRRVVARTMAQQVAEAAEEATAPFQYALQTRAGTECVSHIMQSLTDLDPRTTILSVDGVGAFDPISRNSMMQGLLHMEGGEKLLPFVRMFYSTPSTFLWEDEEGTVHLIPQGEGGEQGDPLMPMLFALGQHSSLVPVSDRLHHGERLCAFLDDLYVASNPERTVGCHQILGEELWHHAKIRLHHGKTAVWNRGGEVPPDIGALERAARIITDPSARVWRGGIHSVPEERGITILGVPVGTPEFVLRQLEVKAERSTKHCCRGSRTSRTFHALGWSCCIAQERGRISTSGRSAPVCPTHSPPNMIHRSGVVFVRWSGGHRLFRQSRS